LCNKVGVLANGAIQQFGVPREVYEKPANLEVAKITGRNNIIRARRISSSKIETPEFLTLDGEHRIFADKTEKSALGAINQNICLAIRPEHISISFGASFPEDNLLKATITEINFQGATTLIKLDANSLILHALVLRLVGLNIGDECVVGLPPDRILIFKD
ncbi:MAG TPA: TOBE domain-containing protein, partial [Pyrinomonadaceae bacterium]|nr:TOBE domain-containing protein [Pyrinomonadaceae bacterium]